MTTSITRVSILDANGLTHEGFDKLLVHMGVESNPEPGLYLHATASFNENTGSGVIEIWDEKEGFESFVQNVWFLSWGNWGTRCRDTQHSNITH
jgi:hypothetical protein